MSDLPKADTDFLLRRAEEEAIFAITSEHPNAQKAHFDLSLRYGARARFALTDGIDPFLITHLHEPQR